MGLLFLILGVVALILVIYHWPLIDAAFVNVLENAAGQAILPFAHADLISTSSTTTALP